MSTNKISKVQLNNELYSLKGDANNIKDVMLPTVDDIYSKITTGTDNTTILLILENISGLLNSKVDRSELDSIWNQINVLSGRIPRSSINYYFAYKASTQVPQRPGNDLEYVPDGWTGYPITPNANEVLYMTMARKSNDEWINWEGNYRWTQPIAYSDKSSQTLNIEGSIALYKLSLETPTLSSDERRTKAYPSGWSTTPDFTSLDNKEIYMITAKTLNGDLVLVNGYYWSSPMRIGDGTTSGTGADGNSYNYVYYLSNSSTAPSTPDFTVAEIEGSENHHIGNWYDRPQGVSATKMYEYISLSVGNDINRKGWSTPVVWSKWGERGMDGDAVEYIYKTNDTGNAPTIPSYNPESAAYQQDDYVPSGWTDNPTGVTENTPYEYVAIRKKRQEVWLPFENPVLWAKYGKDGRDGEAGVVNGYLMTCNNNSVIADDDLFTKDNALSRFNALASATFKLTKTSGETITPQYALADSSVLPAGISAATTFTNSGVLTYTGAFTNTANIKDGDVYYVYVNGLVNGEVVATIKQTIYVKNFSQGESYRLIVTPTAIEVSSDNKFKSTATINVKFLVIGDILSTDVNFNRYQLKYKVEKNGNSSTLVGNEWTSQNCTLGNADSAAANYYVINLYKTVNSTDVLVDSQTINTYKNGEQGIKGSVLRYRGIWNDLVTNNTSTLTFECNTPEGASITYIDVVSKQVEGGLEYYQCLKRHVLNLGVTTPDLNNSEYWQRARQFDFIITRTLISDYISATTISADDVVITEKDNQGVITDIVAGMTSSHSNRDELEGVDISDVRIWAGTEGTENINIQDAPFIVNSEGGLYARNANIWGNINASSGSFSGDIAATSLSVIDNDKVLMLFMPAPAGIDNIPEGAPALFMFYNNQSYVVNMIPVNSLSGTVTTYTSKEYYVVNSGLESNMHTKLEQCHIYNGLKYYSEHVKAHNDSSIGLTLKRLYWYCNSNDGTINNRVFVDENKTQLFSGICIDPSIYNEFIRDYNAASNTGTYRAFYLIWVYADGVKAQLPGKIEIGSWHTTAGVVDRSDFQDIEVTQSYMAPALYSNYTRPISYSELSAQMQISNGYAPNPGQID